MKKETKDIYELLAHVEHQIDSAKNILKRAIESNNIQNLCDGFLTFMTMTHFAFLITEDDDIIEEIYKKSKTAIEYTRQIKAHIEHNSGKLESEFLQAAKLIPHHIFVQLQEKAIQTAKASLNGKTIQLQESVESELIAKGQLKPFINKSGERIEETILKHLKGTVAYIFRGESLGDASLFSDSLEVFITGLLLFLDIRRERAELVGILKTDNFTSLGKTISKIASERGLYLSSHFGAILSTLADENISVLLERCHTFMKKISGDKQAINKMFKDNEIEHTMVSIERLPGVIRSNINNTAKSIDACISIKDTEAMEEMPLELIVGLVLDSHFSDTHLIKGIDNCKTGDEIWFLLHNYAVRAKIELSDMTQKFLWMFIKDGFKEIKQTIEESYQNFLDQIKK